MRLLPADKPEMGWVPYIWLVYLAGFVAYPFLVHASPRFTLLTLLGTAAFLVLYFWSYWLSGLRILWAVGGMVALALAFSPWNSGAVSLWIYAAAALCKLGKRRYAVQGLAVLLALLAVESWLVHLSPYLWVSAGLFSLIIGAATIQQEELRRSHCRLVQAQDEVARLAKVAERERIARDLHDLLGHTLSLITLKAELAGKLLARDSEAAAGEIRDLERISREALKEVRSAVTGYRAEDLRAELARARMALDAADVTCEAPAGAAVPGDLTPAEDSALAFALREAVTNVVRHARAHRCQVRIEPVAEGVRLEVTDDGKGSAGSSEGAGLTGMRERLATLGGEVERESGLDGGGKGTRLVVTLPRGTARRRPELSAMALSGVATVPARS